VIVQVGDDLRDIRELVPLKLADVRRLSQQAALRLGRAAGRGRDCGTRDRDLLIDIADRDLAARSTTTGRSIGLQ
jgi:hypothetical protein